MNDTTIIPTAREDDMAVRLLRYWRDPWVRGDITHECGYELHEHGWLDVSGAPGGGYTVCPSKFGPFEGQSVTEKGRNVTVTDQESSITRAEL